MNHVFISYRHESLEHARAVRRLGDLLRQAGIPVELDQFYLEAHPGGPDDGGWLKWCEDRANQSVCVLIVPSVGWSAAYEGNGESGAGHGAASEAALFRQALWDGKNHNERLRLAFVDAVSPNVVPERLRPWNQFRPFDTNSELDQLIAWIAQRLGLSNVQTPTVRWPKPQDEFQPDIANRHLNEWPAIQEMLAGKSRHRILLIEAESGYGKTELLHQAIAYAARLEIPVGRLDFRANFVSVPDVLGRLALDLAEHLPDFSRQGGEKTHLLIKDLRALRRPVLLVIDTFDKSSGTFQDWVCQSLLAEVERALAVAVIVAGQPKKPNQTELPDVEDVRWRTVARHLPLGPIKDAAHWEPWTARRYPAFRERNVDLATLVLASGGVPKTFHASSRLWRSAQDIFRLVPNHRRARRAPKPLTDHADPRRYPSKARSRRRRCPRPSGAHGGICHLYGAGSHPRPTAGGFGCGGNRALVRQTASRSSARRRRP